MDLSIYFANVWTPATEAATSQRRVEFDWQLNIDRYAEENKQT